jgi:hypothetical protein
MPQIDEYLMGFYLSAPELHHGPWWLEAPKSIPHLIMKEFSSSRVVQFFAYH